MPTPRQKVPALRVETLDHGPFDVAAETPERGTVVIAKDYIAKDDPVSGESLRCDFLLHDASEPAPRA